MDEHVLAYAEKLNATYGGMLKIDYDALGGISVDGGGFMAPEIRDGELREAAYERIFSDPANTRVQKKIARRVRKISDAGYAMALSAAEDLDVVPKKRKVEVEYGSAGGNGARYDIFKDTIFITVPFAMRNGKVPVKAMAEEYVHAFTKDAAPELMSRCHDGKKRMNLFESPENFIAEGIGQLYAPYIKHVGNRELVKAVNDGNTAAVDRLRNSPHTLGYMIMDTMSRAWGRKDAVKRALKFDSADLLLVFYMTACRELGEPAVDFRNGAKPLIFDWHAECP